MKKLVLIIFALTVALGSCKKTETLPTPAITNVSPQQAYAGQVVVITGSALDGAKVTVGSEAATLGTVSPTSVQFTVPNVALGLQKITLAATGGTATYDQFTVIAVPPKAPVVASFSPTQGPSGTEVTITGQNFGPDAASNKVKFNGVAATIKSASATQIVAVVPDAATTGAISVEANSLVANASSNFTVIVPKINTFAPTEGGAGAAVVINGEGFSSVSTDIKVTINGKAATITASNPQQITIQMPEKAGTGNIVIDVKGKQATSPSAFSYKYQIATNTELNRYADNFQSVAVDPDDGTVYASMRGLSYVSIIRPNGVKQYVYLTDNANAKHASLTGISILKTGVGGTYDKILLATNEAKGIYYYALNTITATTTTLSPTGVFQANDAIYNAPTSVVGVSQTPTASAFLNGTYYMACFGNSSIVRSVRKDGVTSSPSIVGAGTGFNTGTVTTTNAKFSGPVGIFLKNNLIYLADEGNHAIRVVDYDGGKVTTLFGTGAAGNVDGAFGAVKLNLPANVVVDDNGLIYVTDRGNSSLRVFDTRSQTSQTILTGLNAPYGLTIDKAGTLYLSEWGQGTNRILKLTVK
jgi:IPT/TIG domain/NHL repeat